MGWAQSYRLGTVVRKKHKKITDCWHSSTDQGSQKNFWSIKWVKSPRKQLFKGFWKSRKILRLYIWKSWDRDFERNLGIPDDDNNRWNAHLAGDNCDKSMDLWTLTENLSRALRLALWAKSAARATNYLEHIELMQRASTKTKLSFAFVLLIHVEMWFGNRSLNPWKSGDMEQERHQHQQG